MWLGVRLTISQGTIWGEKLQGMIIAFKWTLVLVQNTVPCNCLLKAECHAGTKTSPVFPVKLLRTDIYTDTVHFHSTWKNMPPFHLHADHGTIYSLMLGMIAGRQSAWCAEGASLPLLSLPTGKAEKSACFPQLAAWKAQRVIPRQKWRNERGHFSVGPL